LFFIGSNRKGHIRTQHSELALTFVCINSSIAGNKIKIRQERKVCADGSRKAVFRGTSRSEPTWPKPGTSIPPHWKRPGSIRHGLQRTRRAERITRRPGGYRTRAKRVYD